MGEATAKLAKPLERVIAHGHPWIWRDALRGLEGVAPGTTVRVLDRKGRFLARGLADAGPIGVRVFARDDRALDHAFMQGRVQRALRLRDRLELGDTNALRLVHGEGDGIPGLTVDRYAGCAVVKWDGAVLDVWRDRLVSMLVDALAERGVEHVIERRGRRAEGGVRALAGRVPDAPLEVREHGMRMTVDVVAGHKTGMFLDHRDSRRRTRNLGAKSVLNLFGYTGGFSIAAGLGGAREVVTVDVSAPALALAQRDWVDNGLPKHGHRGDARRVDEVLAEHGSAGRQFDLVVSDPPNFAPNQKARAKALKAYAKLHRDTLRVIADGGIWLAASCSSHVDRAAFETTIREAGHAGRRRLQVLGRWGADIDHPVAVGFPEGDYLAVTLLRVSDDR